MEPISFSIAVISKSAERFVLFKNILKETCPRIVSFPFDRRIEINLLEAPFDLLLIDLSPVPNAELAQFQYLIEHKAFKNKTFIFILNPDQESLKHQIYRLDNSLILIEPIDKFSLLTAVNNGLQTARLQNRLQMYEDLLEGEQKLITYMDELLEIEQIHQFDSYRELKDYLLTSFLKKIELTLAVEKAFFTFYEPQEQRLVIEQQTKKNQLEHAVYFSIERSQLNALFRQNKAKVFEKTELVDPFIQELEEFLGFKIISLLFSPVMIFHQPFGALILVNKIYRDSFYENDVSFAMVASQRIAFNLEQFILQNREHPGFSDFPLNLVKTDDTEQYALIKHILQAVHFGVVVFDRNSQVHYINPWALNILNVQKDPEEIRTLKDLLKPVIHDEILKLVKQGDLPIVRQEIQLGERLMSNSYIGLSIYPYDEQPKVQKYIMVFSEITQTKRIQAEIIRMDRMASLGVLSAGIAHEIRNPLAGIKAMAQSLEDELADDPGKLEYISRILRQVNRLEKLLKAFFSYARPMRPDPKRCSIKKVINEVLPLIQSRFREKRIRVETNYAEDLNDVFVDQNQIQQVFLNLFINAIDAMPDGGVLKISAKNAHTVQPVIDRRNPIPNLLSDKFIEISVADSGKGMTPDVLEQVFNPFFTTKPQGTGLGLSIVYQIIREHGGQIDVQSTPGKGTTFNILLPAV